MARALTADQVADALSRFSSKKEAAHHLGITRASLYRWEKKARTQEPGGGGEGREDRVSWSEDGKGATLYCDDHDVRTVQDAIKKAEIDTSVWEVASSNVTSYESVSKDAEGRATRHPMWRVHVKFRRRVPKGIEDAANSLAERIRIHAPSYKKPRRYGDTTSPHLLEIGLHDIHFGMLAWGEETGSNYDLEIAERTYDGAIEQALRYAKSYHIDRILLPVGSDFFHANDPSNATPRSGHPLDVDGRLAKVFEAGCMAMVSAIEQCRVVAPVQVVWLPGNHDPEMSYYLAKYLAAWFRKDSEVDVDCTPPPRKYVRYGSTLLGITHGNEEAHRDLPLIMAQERPKDWAETTTREWHTGHLHKKRDMRFVAGDTHNGVYVRTLPSLAGTDAWHYAKGYVRTKPLGEAHLFSFNRGHTASFTLTAKP